MPTTLTKLSKRQQDILFYLYLFRFLKSTQLQALLKYKQRSPINFMLKDLRDRGYIEGIYSRAQADINKPAVYCSSLAAIRFLKTRPDTQQTIISKLYRDYQRTPDFIQKCLNIADIAIQLTGDDRYDYATQSDLADPQSDAHFLSETKVAPDLLIQKTTPTGTTHHLIQVITPTAPPYKVRSLIRNYHELQTAGHWEDDMHTTFPQVVLVCTTTLQLAQAKRYARFNAPGLPTDFMVQSDITNEAITTRLS